MGEDISPDWILSKRPNHKVLPGLAAQFHRLQLHSYLIPVRPCVCDSGAESDTSPISPTTLSSVGVNVGRGWMVVVVEWGGFTKKKHFSPPHTQFNLRLNGFWTLWVYIPLTPRRGLWRDSAQMDVTQEVAQVWTSHWMWLEHSIRTRTSTWWEGQWAVRRRLTGLTNSCRRLL